MAPSAKSTHTAPRDPIVLQGHRILVVEDEALVAMLVADGLSDAGAEVVGPAFSVNKALGLIECAAADGGLSAAVLDINLDGAAVSPVADRLAALGVPFVFATGYGEDCHRGEHGAAPVLAKPFDPDALVAAVQGLAAGGNALCGAAVRTGKTTAEGGLPLGSVHRPPGTKCQAVTTRRERRRR